MGNVWHLAEIEELEFVGTASLLAIEANTQSICPISQPDTDSSDESVSESEDDETEQRSSSGRRAKLSSNSRSDMTSKFLDRLAEVFAREKSLPSSKGNRQGAKHVAATAWISRHDESPLLILVAKNEGLDERDKETMSHLERWLRLISTYQPEFSEISKEKIWTDVLLEYSRARLMFYISEIIENHQSIVTLAALSGKHGPLITHLQGLCDEAATNPTILQLSEIVNTAYKLRYVWKDVCSGNQHRKTHLNINMLGRLRAAYECFRTTALTFDEIQTLRMREIEFHQAPDTSMRKFRKRVLELVEGYQLPKDCLKSKLAKKLMKAQQLHIHAEMQILMSLSENAAWHKRAHQYIGISRKSCFLCNEMLQNYKPISMEDERLNRFKARQCHGKIYPLWTLPHGTKPSPVSDLALAAATKETYRKVLETLHDKPTLRDAVAESSAGITGPASISDVLLTAKKQHLTEQRKRSLLKSIDEREDPIVLGRKIKTVQVGYLPADGSQPTMVPIDFHALPKEPDYRLWESGYDLVPDFHDLWGECQHERRGRNITLQEQAVKKWEGSYRLYWNENHELPENNNVQKLIGIDSVDFARRFWYGDVFLVRFSEHPRTFAFDVHDIPTTIFTGSWLKSIFQQMWKDGYLEKESVDDRYHAAVEEKHDADKEIILARMTPIEREVLNRMPPGMLDMLAITQCDDGATDDYRMEKDLDKPGMVKISYRKTPTALESLGWSGFDSSQL